MNPSYILVVDDEPDICNLVKDILEDEGFEVSIAKSANEARENLSQKLPDLALLDIWMPKEDGISLLKEWRRNYDNKFPVIMMSGHGTIETAIEATRLGASTFLEKPLIMSKLLQSIKQVLLRHQISTVRLPAGSSEVARDLRDQAKQAADQSEPLLIYGEAGTGKACFAEYIHSLSHYAKQDIAIITPPCTIADLEASHPTVIERSINSTLLLKDITTIGVRVQKALVESIQHQAVGRVIATSDRKIDVSSDEGLLIKPLTAVFSDATIFLPPLRAHSEDIPELLNACVDYNCQTKLLPHRPFSIAAQNYLRQHTWPGNMKELDDFVVYLLQQNTDQEISLSEARLALRKIRVNDVHLDLLLQKPLREAREAFERLYFEQLLRKVQGNISKLSTCAGMERTHLYRKLKSLGINLIDRKKSE